MLFVIVAKLAKTSEMAIKYAEKHKAVGVLNESMPLTTVGVVGGIVVRDEGLRSPLCWGCRGGTSVGINAIAGGKLYAVAVECQPHTYGHILLRYRGRGSSGPSSSSHSALLSKELSMEFYALHLCAVLTAV